MRATAPRVQCSESGRCDPSRCRKAFACGALPDRDTAWPTARRGIYGTVAVALLAVAVFSLLFGIGMLAFGAVRTALWKFVAVLAALPAVAGAAVWLWMLFRRWYLRRRVRALAAAARLLGMEFCMAPERGPQDQAPRLPLVHSGSVDFCEPLLRGTLASRAVTVFQYDYLTSPVEIDPRLAPLRPLGLLLKGVDIKYTWGSRYSQYVVATDRPIPGMPAFLLSPESDRLLSKHLQRRFPKHEVRLQAEGPFRDHYALFAGEPGLVPRWFTRGMLAFFSNAYGWNVQAQGGRLFAWRRTWRTYDFSAFPLSAEKLARDLREAAAIVELFAAAFRPRGVT